jgi:hypothetical protein
MTHDARAREVIADSLTSIMDDEPGWRTEAIAEVLLGNLSRAGLRVVPSEPSDKDVERVARALCEEADFDREDWRLPGFQRSARAAIRAFLAQGDDDAPP